MMNQNQLLTITILQQELFWEDCTANLNKFSNLIQSLKEPSDLIVLPEMFSTGFSMQAGSLSQTMEGSTVSAMRDWAKTSSSAICGSLIIKEKEQFFNRFVWVEPQGKVVFYDKAHLFRMGEEQNHYTKGTERLLIEYKGWKIAPYICYDLRFPVWLRRTAAYDYDLLLIVANWPQIRAEHWKLLLPARAIENQSFVVSVNRVGMDGNGLAHSGDSQIINPKGQVLFMETDKETVACMTLNLDEVKQYRKIFPVELDSDSFEFLPSCNP